MTLRLKHKIVFMVMVVSLLPVLSQLFLAYYVRNEVDQTVLEQMRDQSKQNLRTMALNVRDMCNIANDLIRKQLSEDIKVLDRVLADSGGVRNSSEEQVEWKAKNQATGKEETLRLPKMYVGNEWLGQNFSFSTPVPAVDEVKELTGNDCTILQRMNEQGDMLRIASNVKTDTGSRATGSYMPAIGADGNPNPMIASVLSGKQYIGRIQVLESTYIASYDPIKDAAGKIIGCKFLGIKLDAMESIKKIIGDLSDEECVLVGLDIQPVGH